MTRQMKQACTAIAMSLFVASGAMAQAGAGQAPAQAAAERDPAAIEALERMGRTLRGLKQFHVDSQSSLELVLESGQKVELDTEVAYRVKQPDRLHAELKDGRKDRKIYYDGRDFTLWSPGLNFYATVPEVGKDLRQLFVDVSAKYGIDIPLADLFFWGTESIPTSTVTSAFPVGPVVLYGDLVDQYAYRQGDLDWQVWISRTTSLPRKVVITSQDDPAMPEFTAFLHWDTQTPIDDAVFEFQPPEDATAIVFARADAASTDTTEQQP